MNVVNIPTGASGYHQSIVSQARSAQKTVNRMQMSPTLDPRGLIQPLGRITNSASEFQKSMDASAARVFAFGAAVGVINGVSDAFRAMIQATAEVEKSLKDIQVVMENTDDAMRKFGDGLFDVARNTATSFELVAASATELARQGLSAEETLARVNSALILSRLSGLDTVKSTETLTAAINSFNKEGISHSQIVNRMANVDAAFAVSSADLAEAISRAGAVAQSSGVSFNELSAIVTAVQQRTARGGSVIGNGFKSIFTRIKRSGVREALEEIGVATTKNDGSFRSSIAILKDYAQVYKGLSDAQKASTSEQIAGVFQIQNLQALIQDLSGDYSVYEKALGVANNTTDQAIQRNEALNKTLSAMFQQTSLSAKELAASIGEVAFSENFKEILTFLNNLAQKFNELLSDDKGSDLAKNLVKGIGSFLTGPGLVILGAAFLKIFGLVTKFAKEAFSDLLGMNKETKRQQSLQTAIGSILASNAGVYQKILAAGTNTAKQEQIILNLIKQETAERLKQEVLLKRIAASSSLIGVGAGEQGFIPMGKRASRKKGAKTLGMASGFLPSFNREQRDINTGVGGARKIDRPVMLKGHKMGGGKTENVVAHTGEWTVSNYGGSGGTAIFNRNMVSKFGMPKGAKKITAASGYIPNFSKLQDQVHSFSSRQLGGVAGGQGPVSRLSDLADKFTGRVKVDKMDLDNKYFGSNAAKIIRGDKGKSIPPLIEVSRKNGLVNYTVNKKAMGIFKKRYGKLVQSGPYKGIEKTAENIQNGPFNKYSTKESQPEELQNLFKGLTGKLKGVEGEYQSKIFLQKRGYKNVDFIPRGGSFDLTAQKEGASRNKFFETKATKKQNVIVGLKKAADQYLTTLSKAQQKKGLDPTGIKNKKIDKINLTSGNAMFAGGINLLTAADTKLTKSKITSFKKTSYDNTDAFRILKSYIDEDFKKKQAKYKFLNKETLSRNLYKEINKIENIKELEYYDQYLNKKAHLKNTPMSELKQSQQDIANRISEAKSSKSSNRLFADPDYNKIPSYSSGFVPNFMVKKPGMGASGQVFEMSRGGKRVLNVAHIRANEDEFGSSIYKKLLGEILSAAKSGKPYDVIDAGSIIGPRIPRALLSAKKILDKKRAYQNIPEMKLEGVFVPQQLRSRVERFRQQNYSRKDGKFSTEDAAEYLPGEESKLIQSLRRLGLGRNAHKRKGFVRLENLPIGKSFAEGFIPNFANQAEVSTAAIPNFAKNALTDAISREMEAGVPKSKIRVERSSDLATTKNPMGLAVTNTIDEPMGISQGIQRARREGVNPKTYGSGRNSTPNFAAGVQTAKGFFSTQKINRLKDGDFSKDGQGNRVYLNMFAPEDQKKIKGFEAEFSKGKMVAAKQASRDKKNEMQTIDASRQATMLVATNNLRRRVDTTYKTDKGNVRMKYRVEGIKSNTLKDTEGKIRDKIGDLMLNESTMLAKDMSGAGQFGMNVPRVSRMANAGSIGSAAGSIFETALQAVGKNKLFTKNNARFDVAGFPDAKLQKLFGYYTPFADAKIGLNSDTKRDFNAKILNIPQNKVEFNKEQKSKQTAISRSTRQNFGPLTRAAVGFVPNFAKGMRLSKQDQRNFVNSPNFPNINSFKDLKKTGYDGRDAMTAFPHGPYSKNNPGLNFSEFKKARIEDQKYQRMEGVTKRDNFYFGSFPANIAETKPTKEKRNYQKFTDRSARAGALAGAISMSSISSIQNAVQGLTGRVANLEKQTGVKNLAQGYVPNFALDRRHRDVRGETPAPGFVQAIIKEALLSGDGKVLKHFNQLEGDKEIDRGDKKILVNGKGITDRDIKRIALEKDVAKHIKKKLDSKIAKSIGLGPMEAIKGAIDSTFGTSLSDKDAIMRKAQIADMMAKSPHLFETDTKYSLDTKYKIDMEKLLNANPKDAKKFYRMGGLPVEIENEVKKAKVNPRINPVALRKMIANKPKKRSAGKEPISGAMDFDSLLMGLIFESDAHSEAKRTIQEKNPKKRSGLFSGAIDFFTGAKVSKDLAAAEESGKISTAGKFTQVITGVSDKFKKLITQRNRNLMNPKERAASILQEAKTRILDKTVRAKEALESSKLNSLKNRSNILRNATFRATGPDGIKYNDLKFVGSNDQIQTTRYYSKSAGKNVDIRGSEDPNLKKVQRLFDVENKAKAQIEKREARRQKLKQMRKDIKSYGTYFTDKTGKFFTSTLPGLVSSLNKGVIKPAISSVGPFRQKDATRGISEALTNIQQGGEDRVAGASRKIKEGVSTGVNATTGVISKSLTGLQSVGKKVVDLPMTGFIEGLNEKYERMKSAKRNITAFGTKKIKGVRDATQNGFKWLNNLFESFGKTSFNPEKGSWGGGSAREQKASQTITEKVKSIKSGVQRSKLFTGITSAWGKGINSLSDVAYIFENYDEVSRTGKRNDSPSIFKKTFNKLASLKNIQLGKRQKKGEAFAGEKNISTPNYHIRNLLNTTKEYGLQKLEKAKVFGGKVKDGYTRAKEFGKTQISGLGKGYRDALKSQKPRAGMAITAATVMGTGIGKYLSKYFAGSKALGVGGKAVGVGGKAVGVGGKAIGSGGAGLGAGAGAGIGALDILGTGGAALAAYGLFKGRKKILKSKGASIGVGGLLGAGGLAGATMLAGVPLGLGLVAPALLGAAAGGRYLGYGSHLAYDKFRKRDVEFGQLSDGKGGMAKGKLRKREYEWFNMQNNDLKERFTAKNQELMNMLSNPSEHGLSTAYNRTGGAYHPEIDKLEKEMDGIRKQRKELQFKFQKISNNTFSNKVKNFGSKLPFGRRGRRAASGFIPNFGLLSKLFGGMQTQARAMQVAPKPKYQSSLIGFGKHTGNKSEVYDRIRLGPAGTKERRLDIKGIESGEGVSGAKIFKTLFRQIMEAQKQGRPYTHIDAGNVVGPKIPDLIVRAKKLLDAKRKKGADIPRMDISGVFYPNQLLSRTRREHDSMFDGNLGRSVTYTKEDRREARKAIRELGANPYGEFNDKFSLRDSPMFSAGFSKGYIPNFVSFHRGISRRKTTKLFDQKEAKALERAREQINMSGGITLRPGKLGDKEKIFGDLDERTLSLLQQNLIKFGGVDKNLAAKVMKSYIGNVSSKSKSKIDKLIGFRNQEKTLSTVDAFKQNSDLIQGYDPFRVSRINKVASRGYIPNFSHPLQNAIDREAAGLKSRGLPSSSVKIEKSNKLKNPKNPKGLAVTNRFDEPGGLFQGINRSEKMGIDPKHHGASDGYIPNFALGLLLRLGQKGLEYGGRALSAGGQGLATGGRSIMHGGRKMASRGYDAGRSGLTAGGRGMANAFGRSKNFMQQRADNKLLKRFDKQRAKEQKMRDRGMPEELIQQQMTKEQQTMAAGGMMGGGGMGGNLAMGAMFGAPMINEALYGGKELDAGSGVMSDMISGAGYGAMLGPKGMFAGAVAGGVKGMFGGDERNEVKKMSESIKAAKKELDKQFSDTKAMEKFGEALVDLESSMDIGDMEGIIAANDEIRESISSISDPKIADEMREIRDSSASATDKLKLMRDAVSELQGRAELFASAIVTGEKLTALEKERGPTIDSDAGGLQGFLGGIIDKSNAAFQTVMGNGSYDANLRHIKNTDQDMFSQDLSGAKDLALGFMPAVRDSIDKQAERSAMEDISSGRAAKDMQSDVDSLEYLQETLADIRKTDGLSAFDPKKLEALDKADGAFQDVITGDGLKNSGLQKTLRDIYNETGLTSGSLELLQKHVKGLGKAADAVSKFSGKSVGEIKEARKKDASLDSATFQVKQSKKEDLLLEDLDKISQGKFKGTTLEEGLRGQAGGNEVADKIEQQLEKSTTFRAAFGQQLIQDVKSARGGFVDLSKALETAEATVKKHTSAEQQALAAYKKMIAAQDRAAVSFSNFNLKMNEFQGKFENTVEFLEQGVSFLADSGSMTSKEASAKMFQIQDKAISVRKNTDTATGLLDMLKSSIDLTDLFNPNDIIKRELDVKEKKPTSVDGKVKKQLQDEIDPQNQKMAQIFDNFIQNNQDGNYTLQEIKKVIEDVGSTGSEGNRIAQKASAIIAQHESQAKLQRDKMIMQNAMANAERARANLQALGGRVMDDREHMQGADLAAGVNLTAINDLVDLVKYGGSVSRKPGAGDDKDTISSIGNLDAFAQMYGMTSEELTGQNSEDLMLTRALANNAGLREAMKNSGTLGPDQEEMLKKHEEKARESYETFSNARELINESSNEFLGSDLMNIKDPMERMSTQMAQLLSEGITIKNIKDIEYSPTSPPANPPGGNPEGKPNSEGNPNSGPGESENRLAEVIEMIPDRLAESFSPITTQLENIGTSLNSSTEKLAELPELLRTSLEAVTFEHTVNGSIDFNFNTSVVREVLGDMVFEQLQQLLTKPMILDQISARLDPQGRLKDL